MTISAGQCTLDKRFCLNCIPIIKPPRDMPEGLQQPSTLLVLCVL